MAKLVDGLLPLRADGEIVHGEGGVSGHRPLHPKPQYVLLLCEHLCTFIVGT
jgi:hypothetical protein